MIIDLERLVSEKKAVFLEKRKAIDRVLLKTQQDSLAAEKEFNEMKEKVLPKALADFSLGKIKSSELGKVRKRFHDLERLLTYSPLLLAGLATEKGRLDAEGVQFRFCEDAVKRYLQLKAEFNPSQKVDLLLLARELWKEFGPEALEDAEDFLKEQGESKP